MLRRRVVFIALLVCISVAPAAQGPDSLSRLVPLLIQADRAAVAANPKVWPGFVYEKYPIFIWDAEASMGLLAHIDTAPPGFLPADPSYSSILYGPMPAGETPQVGPAGFAGRLTAWIPAEALSERPDRALSTLFENVFSVFAHYQRMALANPFPGNSYPVLNAENNALARAENLLLARMLSMGEVQLKPHLKAFLDLRNRRQGMLSEEHREYENGMEVFEGLAKYAGLQVEGGGVRASTADLVSRLDKFNREGYGGAKERYAYTGCALALIFDRAVPDWKLFFEKTQRNSLLPVIGNLTLEASPADLGFLGIPGLQAEERAAVDRILAERQALVDSILKSPGLVVAVDLRTVLSLPTIEWSQRFSKNGITKLSPEMEIRNEYFELVGEGVMEFRSSRPILIEVGKSITLEFPDLKKVLVTVDGRKPEFGEGNVPVIGRLDIRGEHFELTADRAQVSYANRRLGVEILPRPELLP